MSTITLSHHPVRTDTRATRAPRAPRGPVGGSVRLTRRGRLVVLVVGLAAALLIGFFVTSGSVATERPGQPEPTRVVMVGSGDTLWGIASEASAGGDVRDMLERIKDLNHLDSGMVTLGQRLHVPTTD
ncbi:LysM peptidoglycan-binding domain-containing protein [Nocardioides ferulae]|uniref:LysM peptidoglycan-binding domain-containing protein n=1 Tax=Nocardioides ferulae TaxID=2340821 RepID=UPI0013DDDD7A|nr:LysM peptidoglycan-binding domain-containing protein [Nocardioides ferulae]